MMLRRMFCGGLVLSLAVFAVPAWGQYSGNSGKRSTGAGTATEPRQVPKSEALNREKTVKTIEKQLGKMTAATSKKKSVDDCWVVGTAEVQLTTQNADIRFEVRKGQRETAEFLADFILGQTPETPRQWHVFARFKSADEAELFVAARRQEFDQAEAYRQQMADIYHARTTRRC